MPKVTREEEENEPSIELVAAAHFREKESQNGKMENYTQLGIVNGNELGTEWRENVNIDKEYAQNR